MPLYRYVFTNTVCVWVRSAVFKPLCMTMNESQRSVIASQLISVNELSENMKTRKKNSATANSSEPINSEPIILACAETIIKENGSLSTLSKNSVQIVRKRFKVKAENIRRIVKEFQPYVRVARL